MNTLRASKQGAFALWLLAAGSAVFWALKFAPQLPSPGVLTQTPSGAQAGPGAAPGPVQPSLTMLAKALGAELAPPVDTVAVKPASVLAGRFALAGVVLAQPAGKGTALAMISRDGKPARLYRVGALIEEGVSLLSVQASGALIGPAKDSPNTLALELPPKRPVLSGAEQRRRAEP